MRGTDMTFLSKESKKKEPAPKPPKQYTHPFMRSLHGEILTVDLYLEKNHKVRPIEHWVKLNPAALRDIGYIEALDYKTEMAYISTQVFVKFHGFNEYPIMREKVDPQGETYFEEVKTGETASTLHSWLVSNAQGKFLNGMNVKMFSSMDTKKIAMLAFIIVGALLGAFIVLQGMK